MSGTALDNDSRVRRLQADGALQELFHIGPAPLNEIKTGYRSAMLNV